MTNRSTIGNFLWVLQAYARGKVLRQTAYRPKGNLFRAMPGATAERMLRLMRWWGFNPATPEDLVALMQQQVRQQEVVGRDGRVPMVEYRPEDGGWFVLNWSRTDTDWKPANHRIISR